ncbi:MAG: fructose-bisphosphate aldolase [Archaeoglobales archaeon]|nr:MAG: fructose-bisphosphate aldolase [Archaeoglobales archaeon]
MFRVVNEMIEVGKKLCSYRLIDGSSGNMSCKVGERIVITKSGTQLDNLTPKDFVILKLDEDSSEASSDLKVHRAIYKKTDYNAVLHCHGVYNVLLSFIQDEIVPKDLEGRLFLKRVAVVEGEFGSDELSEAIAREVARNGVVIHRGHGIYSAGRDIVEAFNRACYIEHSCEIIYLLMLL